MPRQRFFQDEGFEFLALITLGSAPYRVAELGEVLATIDAITDADPDSWFDEWMATSARVRRIAEHAESKGDLVSARDAFLRAANYAAAAFFYVLATKDPSRSLATWRSHRRDFDRAMKLWPTPVERIEIPYEGTHLHGYFWSGGPDARRTIILNNGSDGPVSDMLFMGAADAVARGWNAITFDGPGQGYALYEQQMYFRYDWEQVVTPVVDYLSPARTSIRVGSSWLASAKGATGCRGQWRSRSGSLRRSPIRVWCGWIPPGDPTYRR